MTRQEFLDKLDTLIEESGLPEMCVDVSFSMDDEHYYRHTGLMFDKQKKDPYYGPKKEKA